MYENKKILITAYSPEPTSESVAVYDFVKSRGGTDITTLYWGGEDIKSVLPKDIKAIEIADRSAVTSFDLSQYDVIFRHPTTRPDWLPYSTAVTSATREFFKLCPAPIIAVTGTKGKGTTTTLIARMLESAGRKVHLLGNIGTPALAKLDEIAADDIVAFEISSFQLWDLEKSPKIAVVLMMAEDHLDVHTSIEEYIEAKSNIVRYQSEQDTVVHHPTNPMTAKVIEPAKSIRIPYLDSPGAFVEGDWLTIEGQKLCKLSDIGLFGKHNIENVAAALTACWQITPGAEAYADAIKNFKGLEHRLEHAGEQNGVKFFNDSFSASVPAAVAAVSAFEEPKVMIFGGSDKGAHYEALAEAVSNSKVKKSLLIGQTGPAIAEAMKSRGYNNFELLNTKSMSEIVDRAAELAEPGDVVVLSPGCASFDMFKNYKQRGEQFKSAVKALNG